MLMMVVERYDLNRNTFSVMDEFMSHIPAQCHQQSNGILCPQTARSDHTIFSQTRNILDKGGEVFAVALDIKGTFNQVWHNGLCAKLSSKGITGGLHVWLQNYLQGRTIKVVLAGQSTSSLPIIASVPQGSILGPLLFSIFIDDVVEWCENPIFPYADDSTIFAPATASNGPEGAATLNKDLENI